MGGRAASLSALTSARLRPASSRTNSPRFYQSPLNTQRLRRLRGGECERTARVRQGCCKQTARDDGGPGARTCPIPVSQCCQRGSFIAACFKFLAARDISEVSVKKTEQFPFKDQNTGSSLGHLTETTAQNLFKTEFCSELQKSLTTFSFLSSFASQKTTAA